MEQNHLMKHTCLKLFSRFYWKVNGVEVDFTDSRRAVDSIVEQDGTLYVINAARSDQGYYQCVAHNYLGTTTSDLMFVKYSGM